MDQMLTPREAAAYLKLSVYTIKDYARQGVLPAVKVGNVWRFSKEALSQWLASRTRVTGAPSGASVVRDAAESQRDITAHQLRPALEVLLDRRRAASEILGAIRLRSKSGDLQELLDENKEEIRKRSERMEE